MENTKCSGCTGKDPKMEEILNQYKQTKDNLIQILNEVQEYYGYISEKSMAAISEYLSIPRAEIYGVVTFYSRFTLKPKGKIPHSNMFRNSMLCKRFRTNIR